jgi:hypothetical protein
VLLWLEEAGIEAAMILATTLGAVLLVAAVWSHVLDHLGTRQQRGDRDRDGRRVS